MTVKDATDRFRASGKKGIEDAEASSVRVDASGSPKKAPTTFSDVISQWRNEGRRDRVSTGIATLDALCRGGLPIPQRVLLVGAPGAGKTYLETWVLYRLLTVLADRGFVIGIMAVDEDSSDLTARFAQMAGFSREEIEERADATLEEIESRLSDKPVRFYDYSWTIEDAAADLANWAHSTGAPCALGVDSVHSVRSVGGESAKSYREVVHANLQALRFAFDEHQMMIVATGEMNRLNYAESERAQNANPLAAAAESRSFEYWAQLMLVLTTPKDFGHIIHCRVAKNRGAKRGELWLELQHDRHDLVECEDPNADPANLANREKQRIEARSAKNVRDGDALGAFMLGRPPTTATQWRQAASAEPSLNFGHDRFDKALAMIRAGRTRYTLDSQAGEGCSRVLLSVRLPARDPAAD